MNGSTPTNAAIISRPTAPIISEKGPPPAAPVYVTGEEFLQLTVICPVFFAGATITYTARLLRSDGQVTPFSKTFTLASSSTADSMKLAEGYLLNVNVMVSPGAAFSRGACWVRVNIGRGSFLQADIRVTLLQAYVTQLFMAAWPGSTPEHPLGGAGNVRAITGTDPAAGVDISETVPTNALWRLISLAATLVTDATVINRSPTIAFDDGASVYFRSELSFFHTATNTVLYSASASPIFSTTLVAQAPIAIPPGILLPPGHRIRTLTTNLQAGDNWSAPVFLIEEYVYL